LSHDPGAQVDPFERHWERYEDWFNRFENAYQAEVRALGEVIPSVDRGLEVGVGTGRFAAPLGIIFGVDPSPSMLSVARKRGIHVTVGTGENLPFAGKCLDLVLLVTTVCFVENLGQVLREARRVLRPSGAVVVGLVDRASALGAEYLARQERSVFYRAARFYTVAEMLDSLDRAGFGAFETRQTLFGPPALTPSNEAIEFGYGKGSFVAVRASLLGTRPPPSTGSAPGGRRSPSGKDGGV
jgi:SAM-dependent methyltransferase